MVIHCPHVAHKQDCKGTVFEIFELGFVASMISGTFARYRQWLSGRVSKHRGSQLIYSYRFYD